MQGGRWAGAGVAGARGVLLWLPYRAVGGQSPASSSALELRAAKMTVLPKGQVAAQTHSPAMRQRCSWPLGGLGASTSANKTQGRHPREGSQGSPSSPGGHQGRGCQGAPALPLPPGAGELRPRAGGRRSFLPPGEFNSTACRTLSPMAGCLPVLGLQNSPPTSGRAGQPHREPGAPGVGCPQGWAVPWFPQGGRDVQLPSRKALSEWQLRARSALQHADVGGKIPCSLRITGCCWNLC